MIVPDVVLESFLSNVVTIITTQDTIVLAVGCEKKLEKRSF